ncbi:MAG: isoprenylcysteine carboxylmethyltransferase family protein [Anaerolineales bacterium]|nr:isoprenylcysteine carboxylmethyltransferase family protein [Anaerolineales bacterium]
MDEEKRNLDSKIHMKREDLAGENKLGDAGQLILFLIFLAVWIIDSFILKFSIVAVNPNLLLIRIPLGIGILFIAGYLAKSGLGIVFGQVRETPRVIREGVFKLVRHPIYLGAILLYPGLLAFSLSVLAAIIWAVIIVFYYYISRYEEKLLLEKFGSDYEEYIKEVPMFIPRLKRK